MHSASPRKPLLLVTLLGLAACGRAEEQSASLLARAASLELDTEYVPPPGEALHHHTSGFAKILCSAVFITGLDPQDAAANVGGFTSPFSERHHVLDTVVDFERQQVSLTLPDGVTRTARKYKNQGCVTHAIGEDSVHFTPTDVERNLPPAVTNPWPMGDVLPSDPWPEDGGHDQGRGGSRRRVRATGSSYSRLGRYLQGKDSRRAIRTGGRYPLATRELVDGEEPHGLPHWGAHPAGYIRALAGSTNPRVAVGWRPPAGYPHRRHHEDVEWDPDPRTPGPRLRSVTRVPRPCLSLHGQCELIRVGGRLGPSNGSRTRWAGIGTAILC